MSETAQILCAQCGAPGTGLVCSACGGALIKVCPACQFRNSLAKNYCDSCGTRLSPSAAATDAPAAAQGALPQAGRSSQAFGESTTDTRAPTTRPGARRPRQPSVPSPLLPSGPWYFIKSVAAIVMMVATLGGAAALIVTVLHQNSPSVVVPKLAGQYLDALSSGDYATAYGMLTDAARANCTLDEFRLLRDTTPWTWSDVAVSKVEPGAVILEYDLAVKGRAPFRDTLVFVDDRGRWARPYDWPALLRAEAAFDLRDPDLALARAQQAVELDPRDPMARGYFCEASYFRKLTDQTIRECRVALDLAQRYPTKMSAKSLYHIHALLGDTFMRQARRYPEAVAEYTAMLAFPDMAAQDRCDLSLARSEAYSAMDRRQEAIADLTEGQRVCEKPNDVQYVRKRLEKLQAR